MTLLVLKEQTSLLQIAGCHDGRPGTTSFLRKSMGRSRIQTSPQLATGSETFFLAFCNHLRRKTSSTLTKPASISTVIQRGVIVAKGSNLSGKKNPKERVIALLYANMCGTEKRPLLVFRKSKQQRCFPKDLTRLPVDYNSSKNAWMTGSILAHGFRSGIEVFDLRNELCVCWRITA